MIPKHQMELWFFWHTGHSRLLVLQGNSGILRNKATFLWNLLSNCGLQISPWSVNRHKCCQLNSTDDCRLFITFSVHLRAQEVCHSDLSAAADTIVVHGSKKYR